MFRSRLVGVLPGGKSNGHPYNLMVQEVRSLARTMKHTEVYGLRTKGTKPVVKGVMAAMEKEGGSDEDEAPPTPLGTPPPVDEVREIFDVCFGMAQLDAAVVASSRRIEVGALWSKAPTMVLFLCPMQSTLFALRLQLPSNRNSDPRSDSGYSSSLSTTYDAFLHFPPSSTRVEACRFDMEIFNSSLKRLTLEGGEIRTRDPKPMSCRRCHSLRYWFVGLLAKG